MRRIFEAWLNLSVCWFTVVAFFLLLIRLGFRIPLHTNLFLHEILALFLGGVLGSFLSAIAVVKHEERINRNK
jgi:hypothetical protein